MKPITVHSRLLPEARILKQEAAETVVLLTLDRGCYYALEGAGGRAWKLCDGQRTVAEIAALVDAEYDASPETIVSDLLALFTQLADENLVHQNS